MKSVENKKPSSRSVYLNPRISLVIVGCLFLLTIFAAYLQRTTQEFPIGIVGVFEGFSSTLMTGLVEAKFFFSSGFAFVAGMASVFNPCGFPLLPVYLGLYINSQAPAVEGTDKLRNVFRPLIVGGTVALGLVMLFGLTGLILGVASQIVIRSLPWLGFGIGLLLVLSGWWTLSGRGFRSWSISGSFIHLANPNQIGIRGYFLFGVSFGIASLGCTLPIFLTVVGTTLTYEGMIPAVAQLFLYGCGMGLVMVVLTIFVALVKTGLVRTLERALPYLSVLTGALMTLAGCYLVFYWLTLGGMF